MQKKIKDWIFFPFLLSSLTGRRCILLHLYNAHNMGPLKRNHFFSKYLESRIKIPQQPHWNKFDHQFVFLQSTSPVGNPDTPQVSANIISGDVGSSWPYDQWSHCWGGEEGGVGGVDTQHWEVKENLISDSVMCWVSHNPLYENENESCRPVTNEGKRGGRGRSGQERLWTQRTHWKNIKMEKIISQ